MATLTSPASNLIDALTDAFLSEPTVREIANLLIALHEGAGFLMKTTQESNSSNWARILAVKFIRRPHLEGCRRAVVK